MTKLTKSVAYEDYWHFAALRQERFEFLLNRKTPPTIPILSEYKFTNCYRVLDRASQFLVKNIVSDNRYSAPDIFFRTIVFKIFNKIETWGALEEKTGEISIHNFCDKDYINILSEMRENQLKIYSAAYIMPSGKKEWGSSTKHENNIRMIKHMISIGMHEKIWTLRNLKEIYLNFLSIPSIGKFLAFQYAIDIAYNEESQASEDQFVVAGPGAIRGIKKCFPTASESDFTKIIEHMVSVQHEEFARLGLRFSGLANRPLQLIDCQNLFCEVDKYLRVKRPEMDNKTTRIKQKYLPNPQTIDYCLPKKWNSSLP